MKFFRSILDRIIKWCPFTSGKVLALAIMGKKTNSYKYAAAGLDPARLCLSQYGARIADTSYSHEVNQIS
jgi:hypothetical protein